MSSPASAFIGYGFIINKYEDCPMQAYDEEGCETTYEWDLWVTQLEDSDYYHYIDSYDTEEFFFGINCTSWIDPGEYKTLDVNLIYNKDDWAKCLKEFYKFFPNYNKSEPSFKLINVYFG